MAWQWSHTADGMQNVSDNIHKLPQATLQVLFAEWEANQTDETDTIGDKFDQEKYTAALAKAKTLPDDTLADYVAEKAEAQALCNNGGFDAWICPYGCGCHTVSFSPTDKDGNVIEEQPAAE